MRVTLHFQGENYLPICPVRPAWSPTRSVQTTNRVENVTCDLCLTRLRDAGDARDDFDLMVEDAATWESF